MNKNYTLYAYYETMERVLFNNPDITQIDNITKRYETSEEMTKFYGLPKETHLVLKDELGKNIPIFFKNDRNNCIAYLISQNMTNNPYPEHLKSYLELQDNMMIRKLIKINELNKKSMGRK